MSEAVKPIVYYVDNGAPEPIRSALVEGASWWAQSFEAAGFKNGFQVKVLPADADPMDVRYNVINWVHRSTRGWSVRQQHRRSAHGRNPEGTRHAGIAARAAGLHARHRHDSDLHGRRGGGAARVATA